MLFGTLVALGVLVTFHEFGHFWMARRCGVRVLRFSVGFGRPLVRWHDRQGTEFVIAAIPLGGYVKMLDEREMDVPPDERHLSFNGKTVRQRFAIVVAGPLANFILAFLFFWLLAMLGREQALPVIGQVLPDSLAARAGLAAGQEIVAVDGQAADGWAAINLQLIRRLGESGILQLAVRVPGDTLASTHRIPLQDWLKDTEDPDPLRALGIRPWHPPAAPVLAEIDPQGPARKAGLQAGDRLLQLDGQPVADWATVVEWVRQHPGHQARLQLSREGQPLERTVILDARGEGSARRGYLGAGVHPAPWPAAMVREVRYDPLSAVGEGLGITWEMTLLTLDSLKKMLLGKLSVKNLSGPITIAKVAGASAQSGPGDFLNFLAYLSISLGVLNLLPIPVLDGGYLLFYLIEWGRGRPLPEKVQTWGLQIGISLVVGVMLIALANDISRL